MPRLSSEFFERHYARLLAAMFLLGTGLLLASAATGRGGDLINGDARDRYEYARSWIFERRAPEKRIKYPCGAALIGAAGLAPYAMAFGAPPARDAATPRGWGLGEQIAYCLPFILFSLAGAWANLRWLRLLGFGDAIGRSILLFWIAGTNLGYYIFKEPAMSESPTYAALSLYYLFLFRALWGEKDWPSAALRDSILAGLFLGLAGAIREQNILHSVAAPILACVARGRAGFSARAAILRILAMAVVSAALFALPYWVWSLSPKAPGPRGPQRAGFDFLHPHLIAPLFSINHHGVFVWTPIFLLAAIGLFLFAKSCPREACALIVPALMQYYLNAAWWGYSFGTGFGNRGYFTVFPLLLPGLAALMARARAGGRGETLFRVLLALTIWNLVLMALLSAGIVPANRVFGG